MEFIEIALTGIGALFLAHKHVEKVSKPNIFQGQIIFIWGVLGPDFFTLNHTINFFALHSPISLLVFGLAFSLVCIFSDNKKAQYFAFFFFCAHGLHLLIDLILKS